MNKQVMPSVGGKPFRCDCGCNVFTKIGEYRYRCNACPAIYQGEPVQKMKSLDERIEAWNKRIMILDNEPGTFAYEADKLITDLKAERDALVEFKIRVYEAYTPNSHCSPIKLEALLIAHMTEKK